MRRAHRRDAEIAEVTQRRQGSLQLAEAFLYSWVVEAGEMSELQCVVSFDSPGDLAAWPSQTGCCASEWRRVRLDFEHATRF